MNMLLDDIADTKIILLEPFRYRNQQDDETWNAQITRLQAYQQILRKIAVERDCIFVPLACEFEAAFEKAPLKYWIWDGIHPTYSGHQIISRAWLKAVEPLLFAKD